MIKFKGMYDSMIRCIISEELAEKDFASAFKDAGDKVQQLAGARVVLDFGGRAVGEDVFRTVLSGFVQPAGVQVVAWITYDAASQEWLKKSGICMTEPKPAEGSSNKGSIVNTLILQHSLRSGQKVEHDGDVVISGHVNDGAEVLASGNVTVLGRLRGLVHAGFDGDEGTAVIARSMEAIQVRIGTRIGSLERGALWWKKKVIVRVEDGAVLIDYWPTIKAESQEDKSPEGDKGQA